MIIVRIKASDAPRPTLVEYLRRSRKGRGQPSTLTREALGGYYYARLDHPETVVTFLAVLVERVIAHEVVDSLPDGKRMVPASEPGRSGHPREDSIASLLDILSRRK